MVTKLRSLYTDPPKNGTKFIAIFDDGSGADIFHFRKDGILQQAGWSEEDCVDDVFWLCDAGYSEWIELPNDFKMWGEI